MKWCIPLVLCAAVALAGCMTTRGADGTTVTVMDVQAAAAMTQVALDAAIQAVTAWEQLQADKASAEWAREMEVRLQKVATLKAMLDRLLAVEQPVGK